MVLDFHRPFRFGNESKETRTEQRGPAAEVRGKDLTQKENGPLRFPSKARSNR